MPKKWIKPAPGKPVKPEPADEKTAGKKPGASFMNMRTKRYGKD